MPRRQDHSARRRRRWLKRRLARRRAPRATFTGLQPLERRTLLSGSIAGLAYNDLNANGAPDDGEPALAGVVVQLLDATTAALIDQQTTGDDGLYEFSDLDTGAYNLAQRPPAGAVQTDPAGPGGTQLQTLANVDAISSTSQTLVAGDFDGDGDADLLGLTIGNDAPAPVLETTAQLFRASADGRYAPARELTIDGEVQYIAAADLNADGFDDLAAVVRRRGQTGLSTIHVITLIGSGDGAFHETARADLAAGNDPTALHLADLTNDGVADVIVGSSNDNTPPPHNGAIDIFVSDGVGGLAAVGSYDTVGVPHAIVALAWNAGNLIDIAHAGERFDNNLGEFRGYVDVLLQTRAGATGFFNINLTSLDDPVRDIASLDADSDGDDDLLLHSIPDAPAAPVEDIRSFFTVLRRNGFANYTKLASVDTGLLARDVAFVDVDENGIADILALDAAPGDDDVALTLRLGDGSGEFNVAQRFNFDDTPRSLAVGADGVVVGATNAFSEGAIHVITARPMIAVNLAQDQQFDVDPTGHHLIATGVIEGRADSGGAFVIDLVEAITGDVVDSQTADPTYRFENVAPGAYVVRQRELIGYVQNTPDGFGFAQPHAIDGLQPDDARVVADYNGDGNLDLISADGQDLVIRLGRGDGGFAGVMRDNLGDDIELLALADGALLAVTGAQLLRLAPDTEPVAVDLPDSFGDVRDLIATANGAAIAGDGGVAVYTFADAAWQVTAPASESYHTIARVDGQFIAGGENTATGMGVARIIAGDGAAWTFDDPVTAIEAGNLNAQAASDLVIAAGDLIYTAINSGSGAFTLQPSPRRVADLLDILLADIDGDGVLDLTTLAAGGEVTVFAGDDFAIVAQAVVDPNAVNLLAADLDADGDLDVITPDVLLTMPPHRVSVGAGATVSDIDFDNTALPAGQVAGTVVDAVSGAPRDGVTVQLISALTGERIAQQQTVGGTYTFDDVLVGDYRLQVIATGGDRAVAPRAASPTLYATDGDTLYSRAAGTWAAVGAIGFDGVTGMAFGANGALFASATGGGGQPVLIEINPFTGNGTLLGALATAMPDLAFDPLTNILYGHGQDDTLYAVAADGSLTQIGAAGAGVTANDRGLVVDPNTGNLLTILDGELQIIDAAGGAAQRSVIDDDAPRTVRALTYNAQTGVYDASFDPFNNDDDALITFDPATGNVIEALDAPPGIDALAWSPIGFAGSIDASVAADEVTDAPAFNLLAAADLGAISGQSDGEGALVQLHDDEGNFIAGAAVTGGAFAFDAVAPGDYRVTQHAPGATPAQFDVTLAPGGAVNDLVFVSDALQPGDDYEGRLGNDVMSRAARVAVNQPIDASLDALGDVDYFRFNLTEAGLLDLDIDATEPGISQVDTILQLFDAAGNALTANGRGPDPQTGYVGGDAALRWHVDAGDHYVMVSGVDTNLGDYQLHLGFVADGADPAAADEVDTGLTAQQPYDVFTAFDTAGQRDLFHFTADAGATLRARVRAQSIDLPNDVRLDILNNEGQTLVTVDGQGDPALAFTLPAAGDYTVAVTGAAAGWYGLHLTLDPPTVAHVEQLMPGITQRVRGESIADQEDVDTYRVEITAAGVLHVGVGDAFNVQLFDGDDNLIATGRGDTRALVEAGEYFVTITGDGGAYELTLRHHAVNLPGDEVDGALLPLAPYDRAIREAAIGAADDVDVFAIDVEAGDRVLLRSGRTMTVRDADDNVVATGDGALTFVAPASGAFAVHVSGDAGRYAIEALRLPHGDDVTELFLQPDVPQVIHGGAGQYTFTLSETMAVRFGGGALLRLFDDSDSELAFGGDIARLLTPGTYTLTTGGDDLLSASATAHFHTIDAADQVNTHRLDVRAGDVVHIDVDAYRLGASLDPIVRLLDDQGTELARNDAAVDPLTGRPTFDGALTYIAPSDAKLFVEVGGRWTGAYTVAISLNAQTQSPADDGATPIDGIAGLQYTGPGQAQVTRDADGNVAAIHITGSDASSAMTVTDFESIALITADGDVGTIDLGAGVDLIDAVILGAVNLLHVGGDLLGRIHVRSADHIDVDGAIAASAAVTSEGDVDTIEATEVADDATIDIGGELGQLLKTFVVRNREQRVYTDAQGATVRVTLFGPGSLEVVRVAGQGDVDALAYYITGSTRATTLRVLVDAGRTTRVGEINVAGDLASVIAAPLNLTGDFTATGAVNYLQLGDVTGQGAITIGPPAFANQAVTIRLGHVTDASIVSQMNIGYLYVLSWTDSDRAVNADVIAADAITTLIAGGAFGASLDLAGNANAALFTLSYANILGSLSGDWSVAGRFGTLIAQATDGWTLQDATTIAYLNLGTVNAATVTTTNRVNAVYVRGWRSGALTAASLGSLTSVGDLGINMTLASLTYANTIGALSGVWSIAGSVGTLIAQTTDGWTLRDATAVTYLNLGTVNAATVTVDGDISTIFVRGWANGGLTATNLRSLTSVGDMAVDVTLASLVYANTIGALSGLWSIGGNVGTLIARTTDGWTLQDVTTITYLNLGEVNTATVTATGDVTTIYVRGWANGGLTAANLRSLTSVGDMAIDVTIDSLVYANTIGALSGVWSIAGSVGTLIARMTDGWTLQDATTITYLNLGEVGDATVAAEQDVGTVYVRGWTNGGLAAANLRTLSSVGDMSIDVTLASLVYANTVGTLSGVWSIAGSVGTLIARTADGWTLQDVTTIAYVNLGAVVDATVTAEQDITTVFVRGWQSGGLTAANLRSLTSVGDMSIDVTLASLVYANTIGALSGVWSIGGSVGTLIARTTDGWTLQDVTTITYLNLGEVNTATVTATGDVGTIYIRGWQSGGLTAANLRSLTSVGDMSIDVTLASLVYANTIGALSGVWAIAGSVGTLIAQATDRWTLQDATTIAYLNLGVVDTATVAATGDVTTVYARGWQSGGLMAATLRTVLVYGDLGADVTATDDQTATSITTLLVQGTLSSAVRAASTIQAVTAQRLNGATLFAGIDGNALPEGVEDFANQNAEIRTLVVYGVRGQAGEATFVDTRVAAWGIGYASLLRVATDNGGETTGIAADAITTLITTIDGATQVRSNLDEAAESFVSGDFVVRVVG